ncbi:ZIP Zinc transporter [Phytophthora infestans]|uniref:ZIP Zinc transporter n=1 Tax=Phytophthora infestans TaxID=4787 RepID=A0A8S9U6T2_PHYIN|nr:ZIP Zinc transporter [Phytophthora infestans]
MENETRSPRPLLVDVRPKEQHSRPDCKDFAVRPPPSDKCVSSNRRRRIRIHDQWTHRTSQWAVGQKVSDPAVLRTSFRAPPCKTISKSFPVSLSRMPPPFRAFIAFSLVTLAILLPATAQEACSGHGELHGNHCHCEQGYESKGVECIATAGTTASCPAGGISWELSMAMALENGTYTVSFASNTENMAMFVLPLNISVTDTVTQEELEASVDKSTALLEDVTLPRNVVKASRDMAPTDQLLYVVQRNNAEELAALQAECEANPNNTWHGDHCDGPGAHGRRLASEPMTVNLVVDEAGYYALHMQHNAIEEFGMQVLDAEGQQVDVALSIAAEEEEDEGTSTARSATSAVWAKTMAAVAIVALLSIVGILLLILRINVLHKVMDAMIALSAGALFGAAFLHVLPESIEFYSEYGQMNLTLSMMFTIGFVVAMVVEMALELWVSIVGGESHSHTHLPTSMPLNSPANVLSEAAGKQSGTPETGDYNAEVTTPAPSWNNKSGVSTFSLQVDWHTIKPMAYIILLGDLFHNFVDGVLIATAFLACDDSLGVSVTVSAILHELPQEFADFIILVESGFTPFQAVLFNFLSALSAFIGAIVVLAAVPVTNETMGLLLAVGSGTLVYIAGTDLLPGVLRVKSVGQFVVNLLMFGIGIGALALTTLHHVHCNAG